MNKSFGDKVWFEVKEMFDKRYLKWTHALAESALHPEHTYTVIDEETHMVSIVMGGNVIKTLPFEDWERTQLKVSDLHGGK